MNSKYAKWVGLMALAALPLFSGYAQPPGPPPSTTLSPAAGEVVKLAESGTSDDVILGYIQNSQSPYNLSADDVVYLKDTGLSSQVITAMLNHDKSAPSQPYVYNQQLYPPTGQTQPSPAPEQPPVAPPVDPTPASAPAYVSGTAPPVVNSFYSDLSPYGSWVDLDGYGWCWQPSVVGVNHNWRPYCDSGHWVYTDAGWFWASDYSWGWAPFHYGRWQLHPRCGWVWFPDTVWAPAWVVWRSSGDSCGWAPLPYGAVFDARLGFRFNGVAVGAGFDFGLGVGLFTFVGFHDFTARNVAHYRLPPAEAARVFRQTTIINNYTVNNNHVVVNHGIPVERISAATHTQVRAVAIHDVPAGSGKPAAGGGAVYRHELNTSPHVTTPVVAQKVDNSHPVIQHTTAPAVGGTQRRTTTGNTAPTTGYTPGRTGSQPQYTAPQSNNQGAYSTGTHQPVSSSSTGSHTTGNTTTGQPSSSTHYSSTTSTTPKQTATTQTSTPASQTTHVYYPKGYYQASSVHMLPPDPAKGAPAHIPPSSLAPANQPTGGSRGQSSQGQPK